MTENELRATPLFADVSPAGLAAAAAGGESQVAAGQALVRAGDPGSGMYVVLEGTVSVELPGEQLEVGPGGCLGELALLVPEAERVGRVRAVTDVRLATIPRSTFDHLIETECSFARALLVELAERLIAARSGS